MIGPSEKDRALNQGMNQIPDAVPALLTGIQHRLDFRAVGEAHRGACGMEYKVVDQIAGELSRIGCQDALEFANVLERLARAQFPGGVDGL